MHLNNFEKSFSGSLLQKGYELYTYKKVEDLEQDVHRAEEWYALVEDGQYECEVFLNVPPNGKVVKTECGCSNGWSGHCEHIVATLYELRERMGVEKGAKVVSLRKPSEATRPIEDLLSDYEKLDKTSQKLMKLAAVVWERTSKTKLMEVYNAASLKHEGKNLYPKDLNPRLEKLVEKGLLVLDRMNNYRAPKELSNAICDKYFVKNREFDLIVKGAQKIMPISSYWYFYADPERYFREMRIGRYMNDKSLFSKNFRGLVNLGKRAYTQASLTEYWLGKTFDLPKLEALPKRIRAFLLTQKLSVDTFEMKPVGGFFHYATEQVEHFEPEDRRMIVLLLCQLYLFRGDWKMIERLSPYRDFIGQGFYAGLECLLEGQTEKALEVFSLTQKEYRSKSGDRKAMLRSMPGLFHILTYLKTRDTKYYSKIKSHIRTVTKDQSSYNEVYEWLRGVVLFLENNKQAAVEILSDEQTLPLFELYKYLCQFWVSDSLVDVKSLKAHCTTMQKRGYHWLASELNALLGEMEEAIEGIPMPTGEPLCKVLPRIEEWENALKVLLKLGGKDKKSTSEGNRIAWLVNFEKGEAQARHQTFSKNGWTKGRMVSYDRLKKKSVPGLTPQDTRFVTDAAYAYGSEINVRGREEKWKALIGHPLLFLQKSPSTAVQLVESKPSLIAKQTDKGYQISFTQNVQVAGVQVIKETPTRYLYIEANSQIVEIARALNGKSMIVPEKGAAQLQEALSGLANIVQVQSAFEDQNLPTVEADARPCVHLLPIGDGFHVELYAKPFKETPPYVKLGIGEPYLIASIQGERTATTRNLKLEKENKKTLRDKVQILKDRRPSGGIWQLEDAEICLQLLLQLQPLLDKKEIVLEWPKGEKFRIDSIAGFDKFKMSVNEKGHWFEVTGELRVDEEKVLNMQELLDLSEQNSQFVEISPGKFLALTEEFRKRLKGINGLLSKQKKTDALQLHPLAAPAIDAFTEAIEGFSASKKFKENKERLEKAFSKKHRVSKAFNATLRPYQKEGFQWLHRCANWGVGACLADDMGLGKTIQALAFLTDRIKTGPALVVAPASVCRNWRAETEKFAPKLTPHLFGEGDREKMVKKAKKGDLIIVTYDLMTREEKLFLDKEWGTIILDEAQAIKNRATKRSATAMQLNGGFRLAMSGTPIENHLGELWNLFQFINPGLLGTMEDFGSRFIIPIEKQQDDNRREQLRRLVQPFILRRHKRDVLKDLPEKTEITLNVELSPNERAFYEALRRNAVEKLIESETDGQAGQQHLRILAEIMKLRRAACHPNLTDKNAGFKSSAKLDLFSQIIGELLENEHKALVFSQFVGHLKILENYLIQQKISYQYLDGSTPLKKREERINAFQAGEGDIFLISLKAGGTGLNLTAADYVIHTDPWWNPAVEDQATDRAHRIGQERPVTVYRLVAENTIEEKILQLHAKKRDLADSLLAGTDVSAKLTAKDLMNLLKEGI